MAGSTYRNRINFPSGAGDFVVKLIAVNGTTLQNSIHGISTKNISKSAADTVVTFTPGTTSSSNYTTVPTTTSTKPAGSTSSVSFNWGITNISNDSHGFGLRPNEQIDTITDSNFYFTTTETINDLAVRTGENKGAVSSSTTVHLAEGTQSTTLIGDYVFGTGVTNGTTVAEIVTPGQILLSAAMSISDEVILTFVQPTNVFTVDDLTDLAVGMQVSAVSGTNSYLIGTPTITRVNEDTNEIHLSTDQALANDITLTFKAIGAENINEAIGLEFNVEQYPIVAPTTLTKTIRAGSSSTTINLNGTYGIAGGNHVTISGLNIDNSSANAITSVSASSSAGSMVVQNAQSGLTTASTITFIDCHQNINISGVINISKHPVSDRTIYLDLDQLITVGAAS
jgi:hypothetical protein